VIPRREAFFAARWVRFAAVAMACGLGRLAGVGRGVVEVERADQTTRWGYCELVVKNRLVSDVRIGVSGAWEFYEKVVRL